jgi:tRNA U34 5-methylaminomethyl-2-thiouridine-forming methyltransferase MnmC
LKRKIITTGDGSKTIQIEEWNEQYHSIHGALQEAVHVFIKTGLQYCHSRGREESLKNISILEIGFGTGLNTLLTAIEAEKLKLKIDYVGVEAYPVSKEELLQLNYTQIIPKISKNLVEDIHNSKWEKYESISPYFSIQKRKQFFNDITDKEAFDLIYFDAFGARVQPELWTEDIFKIMFQALKKNGVLVTYSAKGSVRRAMQTVGFTVERLPGPPGKREMLRATK